MSLFNRRHGLPCAVTSVIAACLVITACGGGDDPDASADASALATKADAQGRAQAVSDASSAASAAPGIKITDFGAVCDGRFDNSQALAAAIAAAKASNAWVVIPVGVCAYGDVIRLDGVKLRGQGYDSALYALNWQRSAIFMYGDGAQVRDVTLNGVVAPTRQADWEMTRITLFGASNFVIEGVVIENSSAAGIQTARGTNNGRISNNYVGNTLSDGIHMTDRASYITLENNAVENSGDDGIAVVSYRSDLGLSHHITARNNIVLNNRWGRQMSVVGGSDVLYEHNYLQNSGAYACIYLAQEPSYATYGVRNVVVRNNRLTNCANLATGHAAVLVYNGGEDTNANIEVTGNLIEQKGQPGIRGQGPLNVNVRLQDNVIVGASPALDVTAVPGFTVLTGVQPDVPVVGLPSTNVALGRPATQSTERFGGVASRAVDGSTDGNWYNDSNTHSAGGLQDWWQVDLGQMATIDSVRLWNRTDCCADRLGNFRVFVSATDMKGRTWAQLTADPAVKQVAVSSFNGNASVSLAMGGANGNTIGRYVRVQLEGQEILSLAEVQVFGRVPNLALGKPATQSSMTVGGAAARAVDGSTDGNWSSNSVSHTGGTAAQDWWQVDLGQIHSLDTVNLWNRIEFADRLSNFYVLASPNDMTGKTLAQLLADPAVKHVAVTSLNGSPSLRLAMDGFSARHVRVQLAGLGLLSLAEVQVLGR